MLHPAYQYSPSLIPAMASLLAVGPFDIVLGFNPFTTGYFENILVSDADGLFTHMRMDFTDPLDWSLILTQNPEFTIVPEPTILATLVATAGLALLRRRPA